MSTIRAMAGMNAVKVFDASKMYKGKQVVEECKSSLAVGIEVEVENHTLKVSPSQYVWAGVADGSLRNGGIEYVSKPIAASFAAHAIGELLGDCLDEKECCFSPRTSIHVHINMQDVETTVVEDIILLYSLFEKLFFRFTGRGRIKNIYCVPLIDTACLSGMLTNGVFHSRSSWSKYAALNILPLSEYGTIEFRHMHGTFDIKKISVWIRMLTTLCDNVITRGGFRDEIAKMGKDYDFTGLLYNIFGEDIEHLRYKNYDDVSQALGRVRSAFINPSNTAALASARDSKSTYFVGI